MIINSESVFTSREYTFCIILVQTKRECVLDRMSLETKFTKPNREASIIIMERAAILLQINGRETIFSDSVEDKVNYK